ncbi:MAG: SDR family oxidoreductase [bacterium]
MRLQGRVCVVTGASSGIGRAMVHHLAQEGATLCLVGRNPAALQDLVREVGQGGRPSASYKADLTVDTDIEDLRLQLERDWAGVDVLIHSAAVIALGSMEAASIEAFDRQYRTNLRGPYLLTQTLLPMLRRRRGQVVFMNSTVGLTAKGGSGSYSATKHGLKAVADSLRDEVNADGMRVLSVFLGRTATPMQSAIHEAEGKPYSPDRLIQPNDVAEIIVSVLALPRTAEVTDLWVRPAVKP